MIREIDEDINVAIEKIDQCFSPYVDGQLIRKIHCMLKAKGLPDSNIKAVVFCIASTCAKHYNDGYEAALEECHESMDA